MQNLTVEVQVSDFSVDQENKKLAGIKGQAGGVVDFTGYVRAASDTGDIDALFIEHYPDMTEKSILAVMANATERWPILGARVVHRVGNIKVGEQIVYVGVSARHRREAFDACDYIMDYLKTEAPFWKKQLSSDSQEWVAAKDSDQEALLKWQ